MRNIIVLVISIMPAIMTVISFNGEMHGMSIS